MLKLTGITHCYGDHRVVNNFSLVLQPGQRIALMGPSGCGKTTLLLIALGLIRPTAGCVENTFSKTAAVFQEPRLLPWRTALENINAVLRDDETSLETARAALEAVGLSEAADRRPMELSGGMQQRVSVARALAVKGDCLLLDEPFKAMDAPLQRKIMALVNRTDCAMLLVTHDPSEAAALGCRIINI